MLDEFSNPAHLLAHLSRQKPTPDPQESVIFMDIATETLRYWLGILTQIHKSVRADSLISVHDRQFWNELYITHSLAVMKGLPSRGELYQAGWEKVPVDAINHLIDRRFARHSCLRSCPLQNNPFKTVKSTCQNGSQTLVNTVLLIHD